MIIYGRQRRGGAQKISRDQADQLAASAQHLAQPQPTRPPYPPPPPAQQPNHPQQ